jgi:hypothetical protein
VDLEVLAAGERFLSQCVTWLLSVTRCSAKQMLPCSIRTSLVYTAAGTSCRR